MLSFIKNICLTLIHYSNLEYTKPNCYMESPGESLMEKKAANQYHTISLSHTKFPYPRPLRRMGCIFKIWLSLCIYTDLLLLNWTFNFPLTHFHLTGCSLAIQYKQNTEKKNYRKRDTENAIIKLWVCKIYSTHLKHLNCYKQVH